MLNGAKGVNVNSFAIFAYGGGVGSVSAGATPVSISSTMSDTDVAKAMVVALNTAFAGGKSVFVADGMVVRMIGHSVSDPGPLPYSSELGGDDYGTPGADHYNLLLTPPYTDQFTSVARGQDNNHGGFYIDNVIIGFGERGEMATETPVEHELHVPGQGAKGVVTEGSYQLQIRKASEYATWTGDPLAPMTLTRSFDVNDRLNDSFTLMATGAVDIPQGDTIIISDGSTSLTFQFLDQSVAGGNPNYIPIPFSSFDTPADVAAAMVAAINGAYAKGLFKVSATTNGVSDLVDLFNAASVVRPSASLQARTPAPTTGLTSPATNSRGLCTTIALTTSAATRAPLQA